IFRQRPAAQQRRQRPFDAARVAAGEVDAQDRFIYPRRPALIPPHRVAPPLRAPVIGLADARPRHRERPPPQASRPCPLPRPPAHCPSPGAPRRPDGAAPKAASSSSSTTISIVSRIRARMRASIVSGPHLEKSLPGLLVQWSIASSSGTRRQAGAALNGLNCA